MIAPYSLREVVKDGPITAPRWLHHLAVKLGAQHTAPAFLLWALTGRPMLAALVAGPGLYLVLFLRERIHPSDPQPLTLWQHVADTLTDGSIATMPVVGACFALHNWIGGALLLGACVASWFAGHADARP